MTTAIYLRVSTDLQDVASQRFALKMLCAARGWDYPADREYQDAGVSGAVSDRPEYQRLLTDIARGTVKRLICTDLDRISRDPDERSRFHRHCRKFGVEVVETGGVVNTQTPEGVLMERVRAAVSEYDRSRIKQRCKAGIAARIASGKRWGPPPKLTGDVLKALLAEARGQSYGSVGKRYGIDAALVRKLWGRADGGVQPRPRGRRPVTSSCSVRPS